MDRKYSIAAKGLAALWAMLSFMDAGLTSVALGRGRIEGNPLAHWLLSQSQLLGYGAKVAVTLTVCIGFWRLARRAKYVRALIVSEVFLNSYYSYVVFINIEALLT